MLTWTRKRAFVSWRTGIIFPGIYAYFPGKYIHNFSFKMHKMQTCQKWCNYAHVEENRLKTEISQMSIYLCFFKDTGAYMIYIYI